MATKENNTNIVKADATADELDSAAVLGELRALITGAQTRAAVAVNRELVLLYWDLGHRIRVETLREERAEYGEKILPTLSAKLVEEFGDGYGVRNLARMIKFVELFPDRSIVATLSAQLSWSHFVEILRIKEPLEREFYATLCHKSGWSVRGLRREIAGALWTRTQLSQKDEEVIRADLEKLRDEDKWTPQLVTREMQQFLLELGEGFAFVARQKRMTIDGKDFYLDLLFYHRHLRRLVAIELKVGEFEPGHKGQLELYLAWLNKYERAQGEEAPIGLLLCAEAGAEQMELLQIGKDDVHVAQYMVEKLPSKLLQCELRAAKARALEQLATREENAP